jgi:integrase
MGRRKEWDASAVKALKPGARYFAEGVGVRRNADGELSWWIAYREPVALGGRGRLGTRVRQEQIIGCRTKTEADAVLRLRHTEIFRGEYQPRSKAAATSFADFADTFLKLKAHLETVDKYRQQLRDVFVPLWGKRSIIAVSQADVLDWYVRRLGEVATATANSELACLKSLYSEAVRASLVERHPAKGLRMRKPNNARDTVLTDEEMAALAVKAHERKDLVRPLYAVLAHHGPRIQEALKLERADVDFAHETISFVDSKTRERRVVPMHSKARDALLWWFSVADRSRWVFPGVGETGHVVNPYKPWQSFVDAAGLPELTPHDLRHNFISQLDRQGVGDATIRALTGHKTAAMRRRYSHSSMQIMRDALVRIGSKAPARKHRANTAAADGSVSPRMNGQKSRAESMNSGQPAAAKVVH